MAEGRGCDSDKVYLTKVPNARSENEHFDRGITNGAQWYEVSGGMQDWNYYNRSCFEITIEVGCIKYPESKYLQPYWEANRRSLFAFLNAAKVILRGLVLDDTSNAGLKGCEINVEGIDHVVFSQEKGDFFRPLVPDQEYVVKITCKGYHHNQQSVFIDPEKGKYLEVHMQREELIEHKDSSQDFSYGFRQQETSEEPDVVPTSLVSEEPEIKIDLEQEPISRVSSWREKSQQEPLATEISKYEDQLDLVDKSGYMPASLDPDLASRKVYQDHFNRPIQQSDYIEDPGSSIGVKFLLILMIVIIGGVVYYAKVFISNLTQNGNVVKRNHGYKRIESDPNEQTTMLNVKRGGKFNYPTGNYEESDSDEGAYVTNMNIISNSESEPEQDNFAHTGLYSHSLETSSSKSKRLL